MPRTHAHTGTYTRTHTDTIPNSLRKSKSHFALIQNHTKRVTWAESNTRGASVTSPWNVHSAPRSGLRHSHHQRPLQNSQGRRWPRRSPPASCAGYSFHGIQLYSRGAGGLGEPHLLPQTVREEARGRAQCVLTVPRAGSTRHPAGRLLQAGGCGLGHGLRLRSASQTGKRTASA